jgi:hypothetical protein
MTWGIDCVALKMRPEKTLIIGDGQDSSGQVRAAAAKLTGSIDTLWCYHEREADGSNGPMVALMVQEAKQLMIDIARHGTMRPFNFERDDFYTEIERGLSGQPQEKAMSRKQLPDHMLSDGDEFDFQRPDDAEVDLRQHVTIVRGTVFTEKFVGPEWRTEGQAVSQRIGTPGAKITVQEPQGLVKKALSFFSAPPQVEDNSKYRGQLQEIPADYQVISGPSHAAKPALPNYSAEPALPAPNRATYTPQIASQPSVPVEQGRVPAVYRRK